MIAKHPGDCIPHTYQDSRYGKGFRVMNPCRDGKTARCTVCAPIKEPCKRRGGTFLLSDLKVLRG